MGGGAERSASPAKWIAAAIPAAAITARSVAATIHGVREEFFLAGSGRVAASATVGAKTEAEADVETGADLFAVLAAREWPEVVSRRRRLRSVSKSAAER